MTANGPGRRDGERGAYAVMYALLSVVLIGVVSVVIDLAALRLDRRADRAAADAAAIAGAGYLGEMGENASGACRRALTYVGRTLGTGFASGGCSTLPAICNPADENAVSTTTGAWTVTITWPVADGNPLMIEADVEAPAAADASAALAALALDSDGDACQRIGVSISHERNFLFAGVLGGTGATTTSHSVGRAVRNSVGDLPVPVVALEEAACPPPADPAIELIDGNVGVGGLSAGAPGEIAVDADGSSCPVISVASGQLSADRIGIFMLGSTSGYSGVVADMLSRGWRVTDRPWRDRYNCTQASASLCGKPAASPTPLNYIDQWKSYATGLPTRMPGPPPPQVEPPSTDPTWTLLSGPDCLAPLPAYNANVHADCITLSVDATTVINGKLVADGDLTVTGALTVNGAVDVAGVVQVGAAGELSADELLVRGGNPTTPSATIVGRVAVTGTLDTAHSLAVNGPHASVAVDGDAIVRRDFDVVEATTININGALKVGSNLDVTNAGAVDVAGSLYVGNDAVFQSGTVGITGRARIGHHFELHGSSAATFTDIVLIEDDLDLSGTTTFGSNGTLVVLNESKGGTDPIRGIRIRDSACLMLSSVLAATCADPLPTGSRDTGGIYVDGRVAVENGSSIIVHHALAYATGNLQARTVGRVYLAAPVGGGVGGCIPASSSMTAPAAECFEDLAGWADGTGSHALAVDDSGEIEGTIITPNGQLTLQWGGLLNVNHIQLVAQRLIFDADDPSDRLTIRPDPDRTTLIPQSAGTLIR